MKKWLIELYVDVNGKIFNPCGTEYAMLYDDLKTLRGVINRIKKWYPLDKKEKKVVKIKIYSYTNLYDNNTHTLEIELNNTDYLFQDILDNQYKNL